MYGFDGITFESFMIFVASTEYSVCFALKIVQLIIAIQLQIIYGKHTIKKHNKI